MENRNKILENWMMVILILIGGGMIFVGLQAWISWRWIFLRWNFLPVKCGMIPMSEGLLLAANLKKGIFRKRVLAEAVLVLVILWSLLGPHFYKMTEVEKTWMKEGYGVSSEDHHIDKGILDRNEYKRLRQGRSGMEHLRERYPEYEFRILRFWRNYDGLFPWVTLCYVYEVEEKNSGYVFEMNIKELKDKTLRISESFYDYMYDDIYSQYLKRRAEEIIEKVTRVKVDLRADGDKYYSSITDEDIESGKLNMRQIKVSFYISASGMTEEECSKAAEALKDVIREINQEGRYFIGFYDMTEEEMQLVEKYENRIYAEEFKTSESEGETD